MRASRRNLHQRQQSRRKSGAMPPISQAEVEEASPEPLTSKQIRACDTCPRYNVTLPHEVRGDTAYIHCDMSNGMVAVRKGSYKDCSLFKEKDFRGLRS